jgi:hypothetical protein
MVRRAVFSFAGEAQLSVISSASKAGAASPVNCGGRQGRRGELLAEARAPRAAGWRGMDLRPAAAPAVVGARSGGLPAAAAAAGRTGSGVMSVEAVELPLGAVLASSAAAVAAQQQLPLLLAPSVSPMGLLPGLEGAGVLLGSAEVVEVGALVPALGPALGPSLDSALGTVPGPAALDTALPPISKARRPRQCKTAWSEAELGRLRAAVETHTRAQKRDWLSISKEVGTGKTAKQCRRKASGAECMSTTETHLRARPAAWTDAESLKLTEAVALYGRDWVSVSRAVVTRTPLQCSGKMRDEVRAGRLENPPPNLKKQVHVFWTPEELQKLTEAVALYGRDWVSVSRAVVTRTPLQCSDKMRDEVRAGRL